jgi:hypothetical protein
MVLYLRIFIGGVFRTVFWRLVKVSDASANGLMEVITSAFLDDCIPTSRLFSFASDGASVLTGSENGVAVQVMVLRTALLCRL